MKRKFVIIYILMIVVGAIGLIGFGKNTAKDVESNVPMREQAVSVEIKKAVAVRDISKGAIIDKSDYKIEVMQVSKGEADRYKGDSVEQFVGWAANSDIPKGTTLDTTNGMLFRPGTQEYYQLFTNPGSIVYTFSLGKPDNFLIDNVKPGSGIDVYLIYGFERRGDISREELMSPPSAVMRRGMKRIIQNKRVLGVHKAEKQKRNGVESVAEGSQIVVELNDQDIKVLKALESNTQLILLPASDKEMTNDNINIDEYLPVYEGGPFDSQYALPEETIQDMQNRVISDSGVNELRG